MRESEESPLPVFHQRESGKEIVGKPIEIVVKDKVQSLSLETKSKKKLLIRLSRIDPEEVKLLLDWQKDRNGWVKFRNRVVRQESITLTTIRIWKRGATVIQILDNDEYLVQYENDRRDSFIVVILSGPSLKGLQGGRRLRMEGRSMR